MSEQRDVIRNVTDIADAVRLRRKELRLRFEDVANMAKVSRHLASSLENGDPNEQIDKLFRILDVLQIRVEIRRGPPRHVDPPPPPPRPARTRATPAVPIEEMASHPGRIACLDCGASVRDIARHARQQHGLSLAAYRQRWDIPDTMRLRTPTAEDNAR